MHINKRRNHNICGAVLLYSELSFLEPRAGPGRAVRLQMAINAQYIAGLGRVEGVFDANAAEEAGFDMAGGFSESASESGYGSDLCRDDRSARRTDAVSRLIGRDWAGDSEGGASAHTLAFRMDAVRESVVSFMDNAREQRCEGAADLDEEIER